MAAREKIVSFLGPFRRMEIDESFVAKAPLGSILIPFLIFSLSKTIGKFSSKSLGAIGGFRTGTGFLIGA